MWASFPFHSVVQCLHYLNSHLVFINYISSAFVVSCWKREKKVSIISLLDCGMQQLLCLQTSSHSLESLVSFWVDLKILFCIVMLIFPKFVSLCFSLSAVKSAVHLLPFSPPGWFSSLRIVLKSKESIPEFSQLGSVSALQHHFWRFCFNYASFPSV